MSGASAPLGDLALGPRGSLEVRSAHVELTRSRFESLLSSYSCHCGAQGPYRSSTPAPRASSTSIMRPSIFRAGFNADPAGWRIASGRRLARCPCPEPLFYSGPTRALGGMSVTAERTCSLVMGLPASTAAPYPLVRSSTSTPSSRARKRARPLGEMSSRAVFGVTPARAGEPQRKPGCVSAVVRSATVGAPCSPSPTRSRRTPRGSCSLGPATIERDPTDRWREPNVNAYPRTRMIRSGAKGGVPRNRR